jgi:YHS domain-containing protein
MRNSIVTLSFIIFSLACSNKTEKAAVENKPAEMESSMENHSQFTPEMVVNTTDFACGMPVSAGISDTCHYEDKAYGFCSAECKAEFQKEPAKYLVAKQ